MAREAYSHRYAPCGVEVTAQTTAEFWDSTIHAQGREAISWGTYTAPIDYFEADFATASLSRFITSSPHALANGRSDVLMVRSPTFCTNLMTISS
jgi:hypothetical protein